MWTNNITNYTFKKKKTLQIIKNVINNFVPKKNVMSDGFKKKNVENIYV